MDVALGIVILVWAGVAGAFLDGGEGRAPDLLVALALLAAVSVARSGPAWAATSCRSSSSCPS